MYHEHYGLVRSPFEMTPDPAFLVLGDTHREGLATLVYAVRSRKGFVLLTGEVGTGKTTLLHSLLAQLDRETAAAFIFNPRLEPLDFFRMLFEEFGIEEVCRTKAEYLLALNRFLIERLERDVPTLLIVDEAQNLSPRCSRRSGCSRTSRRRPRSCSRSCWSGSPSWPSMLAKPELRQLRQRIVLRHTLRPFTEEEMNHYVDERLRLAGYTGKALFENAALAELYRVTGGVPRLINVVCDGALLLGYGREDATLDAGCDPRGRARSGADPGRMRRSAAREMTRTQAAARLVRLAAPGDWGKLTWARCTTPSRRPRSSALVACTRPRPRLDGAAGVRGRSRSRRPRPEPSRSRPRELLSSLARVARKGSRARDGRRDQQAPHHAAAARVRSWRSSSARCARASIRSRPAARFARSPSRARCRATARRWLRSASPW